MSVAPELTKPSRITRPPSSSHTCWVDSCTHAFAVIAHGASTACSAIAPSEDPSGGPFAAGLFAAGLGGGPGAAVTSDAGAAPALLVEDRITTTARAAVKVSATVSPRPATTPRTARPRPHRIAPVCPRPVDRMPLHVLTCLCADVLRPGAHGDHSRNTQWPGGEFGPPGVTTPNTGK